MSESGGQDIISQLLELTKKWSPPGQSTNQDTEGESKPACLAMILIGHGLFIENLPSLPKILRDSWRVHSMIDNSDNGQWVKLTINGLFEDQLVKLARNPTYKSYMHLTLKKTMSFLLSDTDRNRVLDLKKFLDYIGYMRQEFALMCIEDRDVLRPTSLKKSQTDWLNNYSDNATFLFQWSLIETAKYCVDHRLSPLVASANQLLTIFQRRISSSFNHSDKVIQRSLINLLQYLDRFITDRIDYCSSGRHTYRYTSNEQEFYDYNSFLFEPWLTDIRRSFSKLSLVCDDPAECWRNMNVRLYEDVKTLLGTDPRVMGSSFSNTLRSLDSREWTYNISLLARAAKQLEDSPILEGLKRLTDINRIMGDYKPLSAMLNNLNHRFEQNLALVETLHGLDDQTLIEIIDSHIHLDMHEDCIPYVKRLKAGNLSSIYKTYLSSREPNQRMPIRLDHVENWLRTWNRIDEHRKIGTQSNHTWMNILVPTCFNIIASAPKYEKAELISRTEWLLSQDYMVQSLITPSFVSPSIKVYNCVLEMLKKDPISIPDDLFKANKNDKYWLYMMNERLNDLALFYELPFDCEKIQFIKLSAAKYHKKHGNRSYARKLAKQLSEKTNTEYTEICSNILMIDCSDEPISEKCKLLYDITTKIKASHISETSKSDSILKVLRNLLTNSPIHELEANELKLSRIVNDEPILGSQLKSSTCDTSLDRWKKLFDNSTLNAKVKSLLVFSKNSNEQFKLLPMNDKILNATFDLDLRLLSSSCELGLAKFESHELECATRLLKYVVGFYDRLNIDNFIRFSSPKFAEGTIKVWTLLKTNLVSIISYQENLGDEWRASLANIMKLLAEKNTNLLLYSIIVGRLDLKDELNFLTASKSMDFRNSRGLLFTPESDDEYIRGQNRKINQRKRNLAFWDELFNHVTNQTYCITKWPQVMQETESFLQELRRISFLCGEYLKTLTLKIPKKLVHFLDQAKKSLDPSSSQSSTTQNLEERLVTVCRKIRESLSKLFDYESQIGRANMSTYDIWFCETFRNHLRQLIYQVDLLSKTKIEMVMLNNQVIAINKLLISCRNTLNAYNAENRYKLYMDTISPVLSRLTSSMIPMPDCYSSKDFCVNSSKRPDVYIHKISQTIDLITSLTCPKRLKFIGSDGRTRSFLLKAHEDLRFDQMFMDLFSSINKLMLGNSSTRTRNLIRRYSVTPVSYCSGLIQWIEAISVCSPYRTWLNGPNGEDAMKRIYAESCQLLCGTESSQAYTMSHEVCKPPAARSNVDIFHQILWMKTLPFGKMFARDRPTFDSHKLREEFHPTVFQDAVERMSSIVPSKLLTNQFWYSSSNSHSYWLKTRQFIDSYATMSIVGYIIGLGDRHPENILIDLKSGEVIHIDYNISFESGKLLSIPEQVPFRLTPNIVQAFGFAGLEGSFTLSCRNTLSVLRDKKSTILHLLDPVNFGFMIGHLTKDLSKSARRHITKRGIEQEFDSKLVIAPPKSRTANYEATDIDLCSQESLILECEIQYPSIRDQNPADRASGSKAKPLVSVRMLRTDKIKSVLPPCNLQHNIKTPSKMSEKAALKIHERIRDKLSGNDETVRHYRHKKDPLMLDVSDDSDPHDVKSKLDDLILLNDEMSVEEQIDLIILDAISLKNRAAMYEGWLPWV